MGDNHGDSDYSTKPRVDHVQLADEPPKNYALSGRIMLSAIVVLFAVLVFMVALHIYARWYLHRVRRRNLRRHRRQRATHIVFYVDPNSGTLTAPSPGLDPSVISSLPVFAYSSQTHACALECAVCLSEFEENENGRLLPKCQHCFHTDCIDMWFESHSTCPLCRSPVDPAVLVCHPKNNQNDGSVSIGESTATDSAPARGLVSNREQSGSSSLADRRKNLDLVGVSVEVPERNGLEDESRLSSPATPASRTPGTRMLSLKRILSMNRKVVAVSPSSGVGTSRSNAATELDLEVGVDESTQIETRAQSPR